MRTKFSRLLLLAFLAIASAALAPPGAYAGDEDGGSGTGGGSGTTDGGGTGGGPGSPGK
jgi:hypothetical protein